MICTFEESLNIHCNSNDLCRYLPAWYMHDTIAMQSGQTDMKGLLGVR